VPAVGEAFIIAPAGRRLIHTYGMRALSAALTKVTYDDVHLVYAAAIREAAQPIADTANSLAPKATGDFADWAIRGGRTGASLVNTDPGAGVIEFASPADTPDQWPSYGAGDVLSDRWGMPSRSAFPAIEQHLPEVAVSTSQAVTEMYNALCSRDWSGYPDP
jgi:hypothetical protein